MEKTFNVYCPNCIRTGRKKLLFRATSDTKGSVTAYCKACRREVQIELGKREPESR